MKRVWIILALLALVGADLFAQAQSTFDLRVNSNVRGAIIYVDNVRQRQTTPSTIRVQRGQRTITVRADGYTDFTQTINVQGNTSINAILQRSSSFSLTVNSNVNGADVYIDGARRGSSGQTFTLSGGSYSLRVTAPGYDDFTTTVRLSSNQVISAVLQQSLYGLRVNANEQSCTIFINGQQRGTTNTSFSLPQGTYEIRVTKDGFQDYYETVTLNRNNTVVTAKMIPAMATVEFNFPGSSFLANTRSPWLEMKILVDGVEYRGPSIQVVAGRHQITIESGILSISGTFDFAAGRSYTIRPSFQLIME